MCVYITMHLPVKDTTGAGRASVKGKAAQPGGREGTWKEGRRRRYQDLKSFIQGLSDLYDIDKKKTPSKIIYFLAFVTRLTFLFGLILRSSATDASF